MSAHLSVQQTRCGCPDAPVAFLPASHLDSPWGGQSMRSSIIWGRNHVVTVDTKSSLHRTHKISQTQAMSCYYKSAVAVCSYIKNLLSEFNFGKTLLWLNKAHISADTFIDPKHRCFTSSQSKSYAHIRRTLISHWAQLKRASQNRLRYGREVHYLLTEYC